VHWRMIWCITSRLQVQQPMIMHSKNMSLEPSIILPGFKRVEFFMLFKVSWICVSILLSCIYVFISQRNLVTSFNCLSLLWTLIFMIKHIDIPKNVTTNLWRSSSRAWYPNTKQRPKRIVLLALFVLMLCGWYSKGCWASKSAIVFTLEVYL
jgi:hypothetical protein